MMQLREGAWASEACYIIGGGASLKGFDFSRLKNKKNKIAINRAWKDVYDADIWFSEDHRVITDLWGADPMFQAFKGLKVLHALSPQCADEALAVDPTLTVIRRKREDKYWSRHFRDGLSMSSCSGVGAINIAYLLGAEPIYLLGFDCRTDGNYVQNYHDDYKQKGWDWMVGGNKADDFKSDMELWVAIHTRDRKIINLVNPALESAIECWPKEFLNWGLCDKHEGMYRDMSGAIICKHCGYMPTGNVPPQMVIEADRNLGC